MTGHRSRVARVVALAGLLSCRPGADSTSSPGRDGDPAVEQGSVQLILHAPEGRSAPVDGCDVALCTSLLARISAANSTIDFALYGIRNQSAIVDALAAAKKRGVRVRGVVDRDLAGANYYASTDEVVERLGGIRSDFEAEQELAKRDERKPQDREDACERPAGFKGYLQCLAYDLGNECLLAAHASREPFGDEGGAIMHDKFFIIDGESVWTGSTNLSDSGTGGYNANLVALVDSKSVAGWYTEEFEQMWGRDRYHGLKESDGARSVRLGEVELELAFSPQDRVIEEKVRPLIRGAKERIDIAVFFLTHKAIAGDLIEAHRRGVKVRVIIDATAATNGYTKHELLRAVGIPVKIENWGGKMHMKSAAVDGEVVIAGSMNWTGAGEYSNDENTLILRGGALAKQYHAFFDRLWERIDDRWLEGRPDPESRDSGTACTDGVDNDYDDVADGDDPGCGDGPPALAPLPPWTIVPRGDAITCRHPPR